MHFLFVSLIFFCFLVIIKLIPAPYTSGVPDLYVNAATTVREKQTWNYTADSMLQRCTAADAPPGGTISTLVS